MAAALADVDGNAIVEALTALDVASVATITPDANESLVNIWFSSLLGVRSGRAMGLLSSPSAEKGLDISAANSLALYRQG